MSSGSHVWLLLRLRGGAASSSAAGACEALTSGSASADLAPMAELIAEGKLLKFPMHYGKDEVARAAQDLSEAIPNWSLEEYNEHALCLMSFLRADYIWIRAARSASVINGSRELFDACCRTRLLSAKICNWDVEERNAADRLLHLINEAVDVRLSRILNSAPSALLPVAFRGLGFGSVDERSNFVAVSTVLVGHRLESYTTDVRTAMRFGTCDEWSNSVLHLQLAKHGFGHLMRREYGLICVYLDFDAVSTSGWRCALSEESEVWLLPSSASVTVCLSEDELMHAVENTPLTENAVLGLRSYITGSPHGRCCVALVRRVRHTVSPVVVGSTVTAVQPALLAAASSVLPCTPESCFRDSQVDEPSQGRIAHRRQDYRLVRGTGVVDPVLGSTEASVRDNVLPRLYGILYDAERLQHVTLKDRTPTSTTFHALYFAGDCGGSCGDRDCTVSVKAHAYLKGHSKGPLGTLHVWIAGSHFSLSDVQHQSCTTEPHCLPQPTSTNLQLCNAVAPNEYGLRTRGALMNTGNKMCHINAALQLLLTHEPFVARLRSMTTLCQGDECLVCQLAKVDASAQMYEAHKPTSVLPFLHNVLRRLKIPIFEAFDSAEVLLLLLRELRHSSGKKRCKEISASVADLFSFDRVEVKIQGFPCGCELQQEGRVISSEMTSECGVFELTWSDMDEKEDLSVQYLLALYDLSTTSRRHALSTTSYQCQSCLSIGNASCDEKLVTKSDLLLLGIQRESRDPQTGLFVKRSNLVRTDEIITLDGVKYELQSVLLHSGSDLFGHWITYRRCLITETADAPRWFLYNDSVVYALDSLPAQLDREARVVLYKRLVEQKQPAGASDALESKSAEVAAESVTWKSSVHGDLQKDVAGSHFVPQVLGAASSAPLDHPAILTATALPRAGPAASPLAKGGQLAAALQHPHERDNDNDGAAGYHHRRTCTGSPPIGAYASGAGDPELPVGGE